MDAIETLLYRYNPWWEDQPVLKDMIPRPGPMQLLKNGLSHRQIMFLCGLRRVGKTTLLKLLIHDLITLHKIAPSHVLCISLDDYVLSNYSILRLIEEYRKLHKIRFQEKVFLFFDEITFQKDYELQLKNCYDNQNVKIYASSSSASLLKSKKPYLTGRSIIIEVLPLDFHEYLAFKKIHLKKMDAHLEEKYLEEYLETGGIPEYVLSGNIEYLKELVDDVIYKDIAAVHNIKKPQILKDFFLLLMGHSGKIVSINKLANILNISVDTARRYLNMFVDAYLIYLIARAGKTNERILSAKKLYAADLGIHTFFTGFRDKGSLFENYVYLCIKKRNPCYVYQEGLEIDFITRDSMLVEVKYNTDFSSKQKILFQTYKAKRKILIKNISDLDAFLNGNKR